LTKTRLGYFLSDFFIHSSGHPGDDSGKKGTLDSSTEISRISFYNIIPCITNRAVSGLNAAGSGRVLDFTLWAGPFSGQGAYLVKLGSGFYKISKKVSPAGLAQN
jgi:hypothetical protein